MWKSGFKGMVYGAAAGYTLHTASRMIHDRFISETLRSKIQSFLYLPKGHALFTRNTAFLSFMAGGALGSFLMATSTGKNEVHELHDIFHINEKKKDTRTPYQKVSENGKEKPQINSDDDESLESMKRRMLSRRKTVSSRIERGRGLSDSHGGHWIDEEEMSMTQRQRGLRKKTMTQRLEQGKGLSDSHSGKWEE